MTDTGLTVIAIVVYATTAFLAALFFTTIDSGYWASRSPRKTILLVVAGPITVLYVILWCLHWFFVKPFQQRKSNDRK